MHVPLSTLLNWQVVKLYWVLPPKNTFSDEDIIFQNVSPEHLTFILCLGQLPSSMCALLFLKWLNIHSQLKHIHRVLNTSRFFVKKNSFPDTFQGSWILSPLVLYCISSSIALLLLCIQSSSCLLESFQISDIRYKFYYIQ